ncbi:MAG: hypothetical protein P1V20_16395, partial [Verrucomicrobiales bacterium]|nr:hypothetical protein [Verrucomicrobiales bacterium]
MINKRRAYTAKIHFWTAGLIIGVGMAAFSLRAEEGIPPVEAAEIGKTGNVHRAGEIYFGAQPGVEDLKEAKEKGLQTIVSLRHPGELDFDERKEVESLGMKYIAHP